MDLGHRPDDATDEPFNMAVMGMHSPSDATACPHCTAR